MTYFFLISPLRKWKQSKISFSSRRWCNRKRNKRRFVFFFASLRSEGHRRLRFTLDVLFVSALLHEDDSLGISLFFLNLSTLSLSLFSSFSLKLNGIQLANQFVSEDKRKKVGIYTHSAVLIKQKNIIFLLTLNKSIFISFSWKEALTL